jgi:hypothetical protein
VKFSAAAHHKYTVTLFRKLAFKPTVKIKRRVRGVEVIYDNNFVDKRFA